MTRAIRALAVLGILAVSGLAGRAEAHPHVWVTSRLVLVVEGGSVTHLRQEWSFDEFFTESIVGQYDADGDGQIGGDEIAAVRDGAFMAVADYGYFTEVRVGDGAVPLGAAEAFTASVREGALVYGFELPLQMPVALGAPLTVGVYDPEYYVEFMPDPRATTVEGVADGACDVAVFEDEANLIYFDMVAPLTLRIACAAPGS